MKGPFSIWTFFGLTLWIDILTHIFVRKKKPIRKAKKEEASIVLPMHKEESYVFDTIHHLYQEKYKYKYVIVCGDAESSGIKDVVRELSKTYRNLIYIEAPSVSKAEKINYVVERMGGSLGNYVYVRDARVKGEKGCVQKMIGYFNNDKVAAVTSYGYVEKPKNFLSRAYHYGKDWVNEIGRFRKNAQDKRRAMFVVCGASTVYRTEILMKLPIPKQSKTEDTYHTWLMQMNGYEVRVADDAVVYAPDVDGKRLSGIKGQVRQSYRWSTGTMQCIFLEGRNLNKNKRLLYSTIAPGFLESFMYATALVLLPVLFYFFPYYAIGFLIGDAVFSLVGTLIIMPKRFFKTLFHYPQILFFKYLNSVIFLAALISVLFQAVFRQQYKWSNQWVPPETSGKISEKNIVREKKVKEIEVATR
jgi:cellulose synthase/poly-beta-1,6-N-acetylglucosamine synthase-like glycosyltransferase